MQTRLESAVETVLGTAVGYLVSLCVWPITGWLFNYDYSAIHPIGTTAVFTLASLARGYAIRRWCDRYLKRLSTFIAGKLKWSTPKP
jgi:ABC-type transport system involved in cytochrome bd biosynthesis fused ATPase/permease subunit